MLICSGLFVATNFANATKADRRRFLVFIEHPRFFSTSLSIESIAFGDKSDKRILSSTILFFLLTWVISIRIASLYDLTVFTDRLRTSVK